MKGFLIPLALLLSACNPTPPPQPKTEGKPNPVFDAQIQSIGKARAVEGQVMDAADAQRKQIDNATQQ
ncbi:hypothetical protein [Thiobacillus thioparus]|uniref:hypothetical protein n=1 Tax=Thiobacillus thioparus TaxID=931 RepID=UPI00035C923E|nr:hypothetical protein [Thiobacillus thioparus]